MATEAGTGPVIKVISLNLRTATALDDGEQHWEKRKDFVCQWILEQKPAILGCQEATDRQLLDLRTGTGMPYVGQTREPLDLGTEANPVFWDPELFELLRTETFWLSKTLAKPGSKLPESSLPRVWTAAEFWSEGTDRLIFASTHWDHLSAEARLASGIIQQDPQRILYRNPGEHETDVPSLLVGDFNESPSDPGRQAMLGRGWRCLWDREESGVLPPSTFHGFTGEVMSSIDGIYMTSHWQVVKVEVPEVKSSDWLWLSDHHPVVAWLKLNRV